MPAIIDLSTPIRSEGNTAKTTVFVYKCPKCCSEVRVRAGSFRGIDRKGNPIHAEPGVGGIRCPRCPS